MAIKLMESLSLRYCDHGKWAPRDGLVYKGATEYSTMY